MNKLDISKCKNLDDTLSHLEAASRNQKLSKEDLEHFNKLLKKLQERKKLKGEYDLRKVKRIMKEMMKKRRVIDIDDEKLKYIVSLTCIDFLIADLCKFKILELFEKVLKPPLIYDDKKSTKNRLDVKKRYVINGMLEMMKKNESFRRYFVKNNYMKFVKPCMFKKDDHVLAFFATRCIVEFCKEKKGLDTIFNKNYDVILEMMNQLDSGDVEIEGIEPHKDPSLIASTSFKVTVKVAYNALRFFYCIQDEIKSYHGLFKLISEKIDELAESNDEHIRKMATKMINSWISDTKESSVTYIKVNKCKTCGKEECKKMKLLRCSGCQLVLYCSEECQIRDWKKEHKSECKTLKKLEEKRLKKIKELKEEQKKKKKENGKKKKKLNVNKVHKNGRNVVIGF